MPDAVAMPTHLFAAPEFLGMLRYWEERRGVKALPDWTGDLNVLPPALLPNLIIVEFSPEPAYAYVGAECVRRWGGDPRGRNCFEVLQGEHRRYVGALFEEAFARRMPIFSAAVFQTDEHSMMMTGRLFTPFSFRGSAEPSALMSVQLFSGAENLSQVGTSGFVHEIRRDMIPMVPELCARLEDAGRYYRIAHRIHHRDVAREMETVAREMSGSALVALSCLPEGELPRDHAPN